MIAAAMGWIGTFGTIGAYVMLSRGSWHSASLRYAASAAYGAWPSVASNLLWSGVAVHSAIVTVRTRRRRRPADVEQLPVRQAELLVAA